MTKKVEPAGLRQALETELKRVVGDDRGIAVVISEKEAIELIRFKLDGLLMALDNDVPPNCPPFIDEINAILDLARKTRLAEAPDDDDEDGFDGHSGSVQ